MAMRQENGEKSKKLSVIPSLDSNSVREQLEAAFGAQASSTMEIPDELVFAVAKTANPAQVAEVASALSMLASLPGAESGLPSLLGNREIANAFAQEPKRLYSAISGIIEVADLAAEEAFAILARKEVAAVFAQNPELISSSLIRIAEAAEAYSREAFAALCSAHISPIFAREPEKTADAFIRIIKAAEHKSGDAFTALGKPGLAEAFAANMELITEAFICLGEATKVKFGGPFAELSENPALSSALARNPELFIRLAKAAGPAIDVVFLLFRDEGYASLLLDKPKETMDAFVRIANEGGKYAGAYFIGLTHFSGIFAKDPEHFTDIYLEASRICGRKRLELFDILLRNLTISAIISVYPSELLKLAEASAYSNILHKLDELAGEKPEEIPNVLFLLDSPSEIANEYGVAELVDFQARWKEGEKLARKAGIETHDREVFINFAYGASVVGAKAAIEMHKEFGIEYFARYSKAELKMLRGKLEGKVDARPLMIIAYTKSDAANIFYHRKKLREQLVDKGYYNIIFIEAENDREACEKAKKFSDMYFGISALMGGTHANSEGMAFGIGGTEDSFLGIEDEELLAELRPLFSENPLVIFDACSTGFGQGSLAALASLLWGADLFATDESSNIQELLLTEEGRLRGALHKHGGIRFKNGKKVPLPKKN